MAAPFSVFLASLAAIAYFTVLGRPLARWLEPQWAPAASLAPALGWGVFAAASFGLSSVIGFSRLSAVLLVLIPLGLSIFWSVRRGSAAPEPAWPLWAYGLAAAIAVIPLVGLLPKHADGGVIVGMTAFDHAKIAMVDEMTRLGLPVGNPFFGLGGGRSTLPYYFLWHFVAAELSKLSGLSGWEADAAMTGVTAYAALLLMMGLASRIRLRAAVDDLGPRSGGAAIIWVALLSLAGSLQPLLEATIGPRRLGDVMAPYRGLETWMAQASWVPQHMASACCVVLAILILSDLRERRRRVGGSLMLGALAASAFGASAWVGGVAFAISALGVGSFCLLKVKPDQRVGFAVAAAGGALVAGLLAFPFLMAEFTALAVRRQGGAIAFHPFEVVGPFVKRPLRRLLDLPAYWLALLPFDLPAIYPAGGLALILCLRQTPGEKSSGVPTGVFVILTLAGLGVSWLLISTIGNNDLGWRAVLPAILVLTPFAAAGLAHWIRSRAIFLTAAAIGLLLASAPERLIIENIKGHATENAPDFAAAPAFWAAVRRHSAPGERVANNPGFLDDLTNWPVNPSWAMLSDRASCYSGWETARAYIALPADQILAIDKQFSRVFDGAGDPTDVHAIATVYGCRVAALLPSDGAWDKDPFAKSPDYRLVEANEDQWRIYRSTAPEPSKPR